MASVGEFTEIEKKEIDANIIQRFELVVGDVRDEELAGVVCQGADVLVHLAASTGVIPSIEDPVSDCMSNVVGTLNVLEGARKKAYRNIEKIRFVDHNNDGANCMRYRQGIGR